MYLVLHSTYLRLVLYVLNVMYVRYLRQSCEAPCLTPQTLPRRREARPARAQGHLWRQLPPGERRFQYVRYVILSLLSPIHLQRRTQHSRSWDPTDLNAASSLLRDGKLIFAWAGHGRGIRCVLMIMGVAYNAGEQCPSSRPNTDTHETEVRERPNQGGH